MHGKTVVVTGANSGIGFAAARTLAERGAQLVLLCRNEAKGKKAQAAIQAETPAAVVTLYRLDLASFASVRTAADQVLRHHPRIDVLINNAGLYLPRRTLTEDGLETTLQVNHFGPFLLTHLLAKRLVESAPARIINVSSRAHRMGKTSFDNLRYDGRYSSWEAYGTSKLMNIYHVLSLSSRLDTNQVTANALHPGVIATEFAQDEGSLASIMFRLMRFFLKTPEQGAETTVHLASHPDGAKTTGAYFSNRKPEEPWAFARDHDAAEELWQKSEKVTNACWPM